MHTRVVIGLTSVVMAALGVTLVFGVGASPAHAAIHKMESTIDEAQALSTCPVNPSPPGGGGSAVVVYDDVTNTMDYSITFQNLSAAPSVAHFHGPAGPGVDAGVQVGIPDLTSPSQGSAVLTAMQETQLLSGMWYINYHTGTCAGGEIRGQVVAMTVGGDTSLSGVDSAAPVTEPSSGSSNVWLTAGIAAVSAAMMGVFAGSFALAWKRSRQ